MLEFNSNCKFAVTDIETNGMLKDVSRFWCSWVYLTDKQEFYKFTKNVEAYCNFLEELVYNGYTLVFHNGCKYDIPVLKKLRGHDFEFDPREHVIDTLVLCRLIYPNIKDIDSGLLKSGRLPAKLFGSNSLKAWGYRLGELKGTYGEQEEAWDNYNEAMVSYCRQDVVVTTKLLDHLLTKGYPEDPIRLEHSIAWVMAKQERNGFPFDMAKAVKLYSELVAKREALGKTLVETFGSWEKYKGEKIYKRDIPSRGIRAGVSYKQYETVTFNPSSRDHIAKVLIERGWNPTVYTDSGRVKVDEETLKSAMNIPETKMILEYLLVQKRLSQLAEGSYAWLKLVEKEEDGFYIHGSVNPCGTVTGRASHNYPNVAQVPAGHSPYGKECRELFTVPAGWLEVGVDACGLELRCLAHFLYPYDHGDYGNVILNGDIHTHNQKLAGLATRDQAKTFIYATLYGAGAEKIGTVVGGGVAEGKKLKDKFMNSLPAYKKLVTAINRTLADEETFIGGRHIVKWAKRVHPRYPRVDATHCLIGLDGRLLYCRSTHSALNLLLQSAGALVCKQWVVFWEEMMRCCGFNHGKDFRLQAWVHNL